ncbi:MAG: NTP transferase domain-containing protein [Chloroflexia bacterium]
MIRLSDYRIAVIVLAAGQGSRMGPQPGGKLLLALEDGRPIIAHAVDGALALAPSDLVVVVRPDTPEVGAAALSGVKTLPPEPAQPRVQVVANPRHAEGMATSLAAGIAALGDTTEAVLVLLGDMPRVSPRIIEALVAAYTGNGKPITIPLYGSAVGPPTLFAREVFPDLLHLQGEVGGRQLLSKYPDLAQQVPFSEQDRPGDVDTAEDYERERTRKT